MHNSHFQKYPLIGIFSPPDDASWPQKECEMDMEGLGKTHLFEFLCAIPSFPSLAGQNGSA